MIDQDGNWSVWGEWSQCSNTCGSRGLRTRLRKCTNPPKKGNGKYCLGKYREDSECNSYRVCPINGGFSHWSEWECNALCGGGGNATRFRFCNNPTPAFDGLYCDGDAREVKSCAEQSCNKNFTAVKLLAETYLSQNNFSIIKIEEESIIFAINRELYKQISLLYPESFLVWYLNGKLLTNENSIRMLESNLMIKYLDQTHVGTYYAVLLLEPLYFNLTNIQNFQNLDQEKVLTIGVYTLVLLNFDPILNDKDSKIFSADCNEKFITDLLKDKKFELTWYIRYPEIEERNASRVYFYKTGIYMCKVKDLMTNREWITSLTKVNVKFTFFHLKARLFKNINYILGALLIFSVLFGLSYHVENKNLLYLNYSKKFINQFNLKSNLVKSDDN